MKKDFPNKRNFCGGNYQDWLEVNLTDKCNGICSWCIEKNGWHPKEHADWKVIAKQILASSKTKIMLLGGEPTLYKDLQKLIHVVSTKGKKVTLTTNGTKLTPNYILNNLRGLSAINVSIHHFDLVENKSITGVHIKNLSDIVKALHLLNITVRFNCNCIAGYIDSAIRIFFYVNFARALGVDKVRFAELKQDNDSFVDLAKVFNYKYGLNNDPFKLGCIQDTVIFGMPVNLRQMCGLQCEARPRPKNPVQYAKEVLYYDGKMYQGWQLNKEEVMNKLLQDLAAGKLSVKEALCKIKTKGDIYG